MDRKQTCLRDDGTFVITDYDTKHPFTSFLPGIAGKNGIPIWTFYVNRGQGMCSFGVGSKANSILKFNSANEAYRQTALRGFRTFLRCGDRYCEPFFPGGGRAGSRRMLIRPNSVSLEEWNPQTGCRITVKYFILPNERFGALVRKVSVRNDSASGVELELLDGITQIVPYGITTQAYNEMSNLNCSWAGVRNLDRSIPFYSLRAPIGDDARVEETDGSGYFYLSIRDGRLLRPICDPDLIFGEDTSQITAAAFKEGGMPSADPGGQVCVNKYACGFTPIHAALAPGESAAWVTLIGYARSPELMNRDARRILGDGYLQKKEREAELLTQTMTDDAETHTAVREYDEYIRQCYLDNILRGGYPLVVGKGGCRAVIPLFSRKHGDPERDYNFFSIAAEPYSQGNGNFRDVCQNRRNDVLFHPDVGSSDVRLFGNLIQADGYNPLEIRPATFTVRAENAEALDAFLTAVTAGRDVIREICRGSFTPGQLLLPIMDGRAAISTDVDVFLEKVLGMCSRNYEAVFGDGFWADHWTYLLDLIRSYLKIFPEREAALCFEEREYRFYDSPVSVLPRSEKYVLENGRVRQYGAVRSDPEKIAGGCVPERTNWLKTKDGTIYKTSLLVKLLTLAANKFSSLDPESMGVEMESNKPGWNDALNGLPSLIGSGMPETFALKQLLDFLTALLGKFEKDREETIPEELGEFLRRLTRCLEQLRNGEITQFRYWDETASVRESYRERVRLRLSGRETPVGFSELKRILEAMSGKVGQGIRKAMGYGNGIPPTYFSYEAVGFDCAADAGGGKRRVRVREWKAVPLPAFLEGPARAMTEMDSGSALELYRRVKESDLYDPALRMYKTSVSLEGLGMEAGRIRTFTPGWLERESVFLHMEYKYFLAILQSGLYREFYEAIRPALIPFQDPEVYGRSILENSSFLASSANPDPALRGRGFVSRLSGSTAEALSMWVEMFPGGTLFTVEDGELCFRLAPKLAGWFFDGGGEVRFTLLSRCRVTYSNPGRRDTFGAGGAKIVAMELKYRDGGTRSVEGSRVTGQAARDVRDGKVASIFAAMRPEE